MRLTTMSRPKGIFIAIEGIDAAGKRTQTSILRAWLNSKGLTTRTLSFPAYETTIGKEIRKFLDGSVDYPQQVRAMLYAANRWEKKAELEAILSKTDVTIVDRYSGSNLAYGVSYGLELEWLLQLEHGLPEPDLVLLLDASPTKLVPRRGDRKDSYERNISLQEKARDAYLGLAKRFGWSMVDADGGIEETSRGVISAVSQSLGARLPTKK
jgi:dTMP kinase